MADNRLTRQQIYDRIRESSKDEYILEDMKRLGFWQKNEAGPTVPELLIKRETELNKELNSLLAEKRKYESREAVLKEMRLKRMAEAKLKREENKKRKERLRFERAEAWQRKKETEIYFLGEAVSGGLHFAENNLEALQQKTLPIFENELQLCNAMGIPLTELRFLSFSRKVSTVTHYQKFYLPKKSGGQRLISAPMPRLKKVQTWILENILYKIPVHGCANGFVPGKNIVSNATPHIGQPVVINADVKDFFPSIHFKRVRGLFCSLGYSPKIASILALICTETPTEEVSIDGKNYFVQKGERALPQGAPTSPALTNIFCFRIDKRLEGVAGKFNCNYTRYADDITFSGALSKQDTNKILWHIKKILAEEGLAVHPKKVRVMQKSQRQEVTGIVVNKQASINRKTLREFRALLHQLKKYGHEKLVWGPGSLSNAILGYAAFIKMVNPKKAEGFVKEIELLTTTTNWRQLVEKDTDSLNAQALKRANKSISPKLDIKKENKKDGGDWYQVV